MLIFLFFFSIYSSILCSYFYPCICLMIIFLFLSHILYCFAYIFIPVYSSWLNSGYCSSIQIMPTLLLFSLYILHYILILLPIYFYSYVLKFVSLYTSFIYFCFFPVYSSLLCFYFSPCIFFMLITLFCLIFFIDIINLLDLNMPRKWMK